MGFSHLEKGKGENKDKSFNRIEDTDVNSGILIHTKRQRQRETEKEIQIQMYVWKYRINIDVNVCMYPCMYIHIYLRTVY